MTVDQYLRWWWSMYQIYCLVWSQYISRIEGHTLTERTEITRFFHHTAVAISNITVAFFFFDFFENGAMGQWLWSQFEWRGQIKSILKEISKNVFVTIVVTSAAYLSNWLRNWVCILSGCECRLYMPTYTVYAYIYIYIYLPKCIHLLGFHYYWWMITPVMHVRV